MKKTVLFVNPERDRGLAVSGKVRAMLEKRGIPYVVCTQSGELPEAVESAELVITFGGDGTILHCARAVASVGVPILGVNLGTRGFMAELEPSELELIPRVWAGEYTIERRMTIDVSLLRGGHLKTDFALNDAVVRGLTRVVELTVLGDGNTIMRFTGDGVVISTPTGSTAYSMAAGGPLVEPDAENIILTPICPHRLWARSYVLSPERTVSVRPERLGERRAVLSCDGGEPVELEDGDTVEIRKSDVAVRLVRLTDRSFYEKVSRKLGETG